MLSIIVAVSENGVIGKNNQLLWRLSADLKHFKNLTTGHPIIMGRKTFESIGKPLPHRENIVITSNPELSLPSGSTSASLWTASSLSSAIYFAKNLNYENEIFIIGGGNVYAQALHLVDKIYLTLVKTTIEGDTFFPTLNPSEWQEISRISYQKDEKNEYDYDFIEYIRRK